MPNAKTVNKWNGMAFLDPQDGASGLAQVADNDPLRSTYSLFLPGVTPAATPTDILEIRGAAGVVTKIRQIVLSGVATSASNILPYLLRRSTAATGGTPTTQTLARRDLNNDPAATQVRTFAANPTTGTLVNTVDGGRLNIAPAANGGIDRLLFQYSWLNDEALTLRGTSDFLCLNFNGAAWPGGGAVDISLVLTEE